MKSKIALYASLILIQFGIVSTITFAQNSNEKTPPKMVNYVNLQKYSGL